MNATELIDLQRYPIHTKDERYNLLVEGVRDQLSRDGCAVLSGFLTQSGISQLCKEADSVAQYGHRQKNRTNPYFTTDDPSLPEDDPRRTFFDRSNIFIAADNFTHDGALRSIHDYTDFDPFIRDCLEEINFYRYADPLADVIVNMAEEGNGFPWHFDTNNFTVTLAIQNADSGGAFEYAANIRSDSENFEAVKSVLAGRSELVTRIDLQPGDLQLFRGRNSLHRVAPLFGQTPRYVAIFSYVEEPDMVGSPERTKQLYGKVLPIHLAKKADRKDGFLD